MVNDPWLMTKRLSPRGLRPSDADLVFRLEDDPRVMRFINGGLPAVRAKVEGEVLPAMLRSGSAAEGTGVFVVIESSSGAVCGWVSFRVAPEMPGAGTLGFRLHTACWGKGYGSEAAAAVVRKGFRALKIDRVVATTYEGNAASRRVLGKLGMKLVRRFRPSSNDLTKETMAGTHASDVWEGDELEFAVTRAEWIGRFAPTDVG